MLRCLVHVLRVKLMLSIHGTKRTHRTILKFELVQLTLDLFLLLCCGGLPGNFWQCRPTLCLRLLLNIGVAGHIDGR